MKTYRIEFYSLDGHLQTVFIDAETEKEARRVFEGSYEYDEAEGIEIYDE